VRPLAEPHHTRRARSHPRAGPPSRGAWPPSSALRRVAIPPESRTIRTDTLEIAYEQQGDQNGFPVILLHGFPDDVRTWDGVTPFLVSAHRVLVPYLRGFGPTRLLDPNAPRMAQQAAIGQDLLDFMDALGLDRVALAGYDWGGRAGCIASILAPERVRALVTIGGYNVQNTLGPPRPASAIEERAYWYQWYFNTERGRLGLEKNRREICRLLWREWSPSWRFDEATFERTAAAFDNRDFVDVVIHSYRHRHGNAPGEPRFDGIERRLAERPPILVPSVVLHGAEDTVDAPPRSQRHMALFPAGTERQIIMGGGHLLPREQPAAIAAALLKLLMQTK
jgi:pimeloyl-ACP methyl ester carboxylesterase